MPDSARQSHVRFENPNTALTGFDASATAQANTSTTIVRTPVARFESTSRTPTLARIAVAPANTADNNAQKNRFICEALKDRPADRHHEICSSIVTSPGETI
jgi:hypothetical protein